MSTITTRAATFVAYDYTSQKWIAGAEAIRVRLAQLTQEVAILCSDEGARYFAFTKPRNGTGTLRNAVTNKLGALHDLIALGMAHNSECANRGACIASEMTQAREAIALVEAWQAEDGR